MTSCLLSWTIQPFKIGSSIKGKYLLLGSKFFSLRVDPNEIGGKMKTRVASPESIPIHHEQVISEEQLPVIA